MCVCVYFFKKKGNLIVGEADSFDYNNSFIQLKKK